MSPKIGGRRKSMSPKIRSSKTPYPTVTVFVVQIWRSSKFGGSSSQCRANSKVVQIWRLFYFRGRPNFDVQISTSNFHALYTTVIVVSSKFLSCNFRSHSTFAIPIKVTSKFHMPIYYIRYTFPFKIPQNENLAS